MTEITDLQIIWGVIGGMIVGFIILYAVLQFKDIHQRLNFLQGEIDYTESSSNTLNVSLEQSAHVEGRAADLAREVADVVDATCACGDGWICTSCQVEEAAYKALRAYYAEGHVKGYEEARHELTQTPEFTSGLRSGVTG